MAHVRVRVKKLPEAALPASPFVAQYQTFGARGGMSVVPSTEAACPHSITSSALECNSQSLIGLASRHAWRIA